MPNPSNRDQYSHLPIPTYDEAISSRPNSSLSHTGPEEISDDAERQGLLRRQSNYEPPTVESARGSIDSLDGIDEPSSPSRARREMEQMDIEDPLNDSASNRSLLRQRFAKNFSWTSSFSSLTLPSFRSWIPSFSLPRFSYDSIDSHRAIIIGRLFGIFVILGVVYALIATDILAFGRSRLSIGQMYDPESIRVFVQKHVNNRDKMQEYLEHVTEFPHLAGTEGSYVVAEWIAEVFKTAQLEDVDMERFDVYLNYPRRNGRKVAIVEPKEKVWEATLEEEAEQTAVFHGHAKAGNVQGPVIYANYGSRDDFKKLKEEGVDVKGAVVLMRYYGTQGDAGLKVKAAELAGAVGAILYTDPADNGYVKGDTFPGRYLPEDGVQRDSVSLQSWVVGDLLSPGYAATPGNRHRDNKEDSPGLNKIPSLPVSWNDAKHLLESIKGLGKQMNRDWQGDKAIEYWTGSQNSPVVNVKNEQDDEVYQPIYNVVGRMTGWEQPEKRIVVGNHHDAWCLGAADPGTGTAIMLDIIRIFGELRSHGWRPLRTIEFASWDSAIYNLEGSTEHVENRIDELRQDGIAYVNIGAGITGQDLVVSGSPTMRRVIIDSASRVRDPTAVVDDVPRSFKDNWESQGANLNAPGGRVDYVPFQHIAGMSSLDIGLHGDVYPSGSCYDRSDWVTSQVDSEGFLYHKALGEIFALIILELADKPMLPLDLEAYATSLAHWRDDLAGYANNHGFDKLDLKPLSDSINLVTDAAKEARGIEEHWVRHVFAHGGFEGNRMAMLRLLHNERVAQFEKSLLDLSDDGGLRDRKQYKHTIFAPDKWDSTKASTFPGVRDAIDDGKGDIKEAQFAVQVVSDRLRDAAAALRRPPGEEDGMG